MDAFTENKETVEIFEDTWDLRLSSWYCSLYDINTLQNGKSRRNNKTPDQASDIYTEKSESSNTNNELDNLTLAEYAKRIYPLGTLTYVSKIKSYNAEEKSHKKSIQAAYKANSNQGYHNNSNNDSGRGKSGMRSQKPVKDGDKENLITIDDHEKTVRGVW